MIAQRKRLEAATKHLAASVACAVVSLTVALERGHAIDVWFDGSTSNDYNVDSNWSPFNFRPEAQFNELAVIGYDDPVGQLNANVTLAATPPNPGGIRLGLRERDATTGAFVNPAPAAGALTGSLTISSGSLTAVPGTAGGIDGRVLVGVDGRGYLTMTGGTLNARALVVAGENITTGAGASLVDLSGSAVVNITGTGGQEGLTTFGRRLRITGPGVNFSTSRNLRLESSNTYTAVITSSTAHSPLKTGANAIVNGALQVQFSGAGATHALGQSWDLIDSSLNANAIAGNFNNLGPGGDVQVSGLAAAPPLGAVYRLRKTSTPANHSLLQLVYDRVLVLQVNRDTGELRIRNPLSGAIAIDSYSVTSGLGSLVSSYSGISGQGAPPDAGWAKAAANSTTILTELKTPDVTPPIGNQEAFNLASIPSGITLGTGFSRTAVGATADNLGRDGEDLVFTYGGPQFGTDVIRGVVEYIGTKFENNLVLRVNPTTGQAFLKNDSLFSLSFDGFSIRSTEPVLDAGWTGIVAAGWEKTPATTTALSQTNPVGTQTLAPGAQVAIGDIGAFTTAAARDGLSMEFILSSGFGGSPFDFNADGNVDGTDLLFWQRRAGTATGTAAELAGWRAAFGGGGGGAPETDFRLGSIVFDAAAGVAAAGQVPEPGAASLLAVGLLAGLGARRSVSRRARSAIRNQGECIMFHKPLGVRLAAAAGCCVATLIASTALAVTQGIPVVNGRAELPGPVGVKTLAFNADGSPNTEVQATMGWTFPGPGVEDFGHAGVLGDSGTEGGGNPGNEFLLSTRDGVMFQTTTFNVVSIPATQKYLLSFQAHDVFTIDAGGAGVSGGNQITARLYYVNGGVRTTLGSPLVISGTPGAFTNYQIEVVGGAPALTPAIGRPIGIEFDVTSIEFNPVVARSWGGFDNISLQIAGVLDGDLDGDGDVDLDDYRRIRNNLQQARDSLAEGDMNGDGFVNLADFRAWKSLPPVVASGVLSQIAIPEPSTAALVLAAAVMGRRVVRRGWRGGRPFRTPLVAACAAGLVLAAGSRVSAELLFYDPFLIGNNPAAGEYTLGFVDPTQAPNDGQNPTIGPTPFFSGPWDIRESDGNAPNQHVVAQGLSFLGAPAAGGAVQPVLNAEGTSSDGRVGRYLTNPWTSTTEGTFYISYLASYGTAANPNATGSEGQADLGFRTTEFWPEGGTVGNDSGRSEIGYQGFGGEAAERIPATAHLRAVFPGGGTQLLTDTTFNQDNGATHLLVIKFVLSAAPASDSISVFLDPTSAEEPVLANATFTGADFTLSAISTVSRFGTPGGIMPIFDELRVATTFADAVPDFPLPGDTNNDGVVDIVDYNNIFAYMNLTGTDVPNTLELHPDVTGDGRVTIADFRLWKQNRTDLSAALPHGIGIPEPAGATLALVAAAALTARRRSRGRAAKDLISRVAS